MRIATEFYGAGLGDRLIDPTFFPDGIRQFLGQEETLINAIRPVIDGIIEVGCMHGRYLDWAVRHSLKYTGIDVVESYIDRGRDIVRQRQLDPDRHKLILGDAANLSILLPSNDNAGNLRREALLFPFNSFGNMSAPQPVLRSIKDVGLPFLITSYRTTQLATRIREQYYSNCGYIGLQTTYDERGVHFVSSDGLSSFAYHPEYLRGLFASCDLNSITAEFADIGIAYTSFDKQLLAAHA